MLQDTIEKLFPKAWEALSCPTDYQYSDTFLDSAKCELKSVARTLQDIAKIQQRIFHEKAEPAHGTQQPQGEICWHCETYPSMMSDWVSYKYVFCPYCCRKLPPVR